MADILVIEDEALLRDNLARFLKLEGHTVRTAENGRLGMEKVREALPELVLCDQMMPEMTGMEVLQALRADPATAAVRFVFLTARAEEDAMQGGLDAGANAYITKPYNLKDLKDAMNKLFAGSSA